MLLSIYSAPIDIYGQPSVITHENHEVSLAFDRYYVISRNYNQLDFSNAQPTTDISNNQVFKLFQAEGDVFYELLVRNNKKIRAIQNMNLLPGSSLGVNNSTSQSHETYFEGSVIQF